MKPEENKPHKCKCQTHTATKGEAKYKLLRGVIKSLCNSPLSDDIKLGVIMDTVKDIDEATA